MATRDDYSGFAFYQAITPDIYETDATGTTIDTQGYETVTFVVTLGELSSITSSSYWVIALQHTSNAAAGGASDFVNCDSTHMIRSSTGTITSGAWMIILSDDFSKTTSQVGYIGGLRYVRLAIWSRANLSTAEIAAVAILGRPANWPVNTAVSPGLQA